MQFHELFHAGSLEGLTVGFFFFYFIGFLDYMLTFLLAD